MDRMGIRRVKQPQAQERRKHKGVGKDGYHEGLYDESSLGRYRKNGWSGRALSVQDGDEEVQREKLFDTRYYVKDK
ncbi:hypothetical protein Dimus_013063, partial [Dionaea muscipula]